MKTRNKINIINIITICVAVASLALGIYNQWYIQNLPSSDELVIEGKKQFDTGEYKRAVKYFDDALRIHESDANTWKYKGFALFNLGIDNESVSIKRSNRPPYSYAKELIDYYNLYYHPTGISQDYLERSLECFKKAVYYDPKDSEAWLYEGIVCFYVSPSPICYPIEDFNETLTRIDNLPYEQKSYPPLRDIKSYAWYGIKKAEEYFGKANETK